MSLELLLWIVAISGLSPRLEKPLYGLLYGPEKKPPVFTVFGPLRGRGSTLVNTGGRSFTSAMSCFKSLYFCIHRHSAPSNDNVYPIFLNFTRGIGAVIPTPAIIDRKGPVKIPHHRRRRRRLPAI